MALTADEQNELAGLQKQSSPSGGLTPEEQAELHGLQNSPSKYGQGQTLLEHSQNGLLMGYLPQVQAGLGALVPKTSTEKDLEARGFKISRPDEDTYVARRDAVSQRLSDESKENPKTATAGEIGGGALGAMATPIPVMSRAGGLVGGAVKGGLYGTIQGALANPGDTKGQINPLQPGDRYKGAQRGAIYGSVAGGVAGGTRGALNALENSPQSLRETAADQAIKASGGMLKNFRSLAAQNAIKIAPNALGGAAGGAALGAMSGSPSVMAKDAAVGGGVGAILGEFSPEEKSPDESRLRDMGKFALDNKIVEAGDSTADVASKAEAFNKDAGERLEKIYSSVDENNRYGFNPEADKKEIVQTIAKEMGNARQTKSATEAVSKWIDDLAEIHGNNPLDPRTANDIKGEIDNEINYARNPLTKQPANEKAFQIFRRIVSSKIDDQINQIGQESNNPQALQDLKLANRDYGYSKQLSQMANDRVGRDTANRVFSLTDTISAGAGSHVGEGIGSAMGHGGPKERALGAVAGAVGGGAINNTARRYGPSTLAAYANKAAPIFESTNIPAMAEGLNYITPSDQTASRAFVQALQNKQNDLKTRRQER